MSALLRRAQAGGAFAAVVAKGDPDFGDVMVKVNLLDGAARVFTTATTLEGAREWIEPLGETASAEADADSFLDRRRNADPDVWIIEIEDRQGRNFIV